jgi:hypothetical protein
VRADREGWPARRALRHNADVRVKRLDRIVACARCRRTLLLGEQVHVYRIGERVASVCTLCQPAVEARGGTPVDEQVA